MNITSATRSIALCVSIFLASGNAGWGQSEPPQKDQATTNAGSGGKSAEPMGSKGSKGSPLQSDSDKTEKKKTTTTKKQKGKKPDPTTKSGSSS